MRGQARTYGLLAVLLACVWLFAGTAQATQPVKLRVAFVPERLGKGTTVEITAEILAPHGRVPPPLTGLSLRYPHVLGVTVGGLGLDTCSQSTVETWGIGRCPANSFMGGGTALTEIQIGPEIIQETAVVSIVRAPEQDARPALLFYVVGISPIDAQITLPAVLLPGPGTSEESIHIDVPLIPSVPEAPDVAVVRLHATIGPLGLVYYEHVRNRLVPYRPEGVILPRKCPHTGFRFAATFAFLDGSRSEAQTTIPCRSRRRGGRR